MQSRAMKQRSPEDISCLPLRKESLAQVERNHSGRSQFEEIANWLLALGTEFHRCYLSLRVVPIGHVQSEPTCCEKVQVLDTHVTHRNLRPATLPARSRRWNEVLFYPHVFGSPTGRRAYSLWRWKQFEFLSHATPCSRKSAERNNSCKRFRRAIGP